MLDLIKFPLFVSVFLYVPGRLLLRWANLKLGGSATFVLSVALGICALVYLAFLIRLAHLPFTILYLYGILSVLFAIKHKKFSIWTVSFPRLNKLQLLGIFLGGICVLALSAGQFRSRISDGGLYFAGGRDGLWRLGIISELLHAPIPQVPGFAGELLKNYHYFYDLLLAATQALTGISAIWLYSYWYMLLVAGLFVGGVYTLLSVWVKSTPIRLYGTALTIFTGNLSYILPWLSNRYHFLAKSNIFMSDQPFDQSLNPFNLLAYALFLISIYLCSQWNRDKTYRTFLLLSLVMGTLVGIKIYAGATLLGGFAFTLIFKIYKGRSFAWWWITPFVLAASVLFSIKGRGFNLLRFNPGWVLDKMIQDQDRLFLTDMELRQEHYLQSGNYIRIVFLKVQQLGIYLLGNLNTRILALGLIIKRFRPKMDLTLLFLLSSTIIGICAAIFYSQSRAVYDSIQFSQYGWLGASILCVIFLNNLSRVVPRTLKYVILGTILAVSIPTNLVVLHGQIRGGTFFIGRFELEGLEFLRLNTEREALVLNDLSEAKESTLYVPVFSDRRSFLSAPSLAGQTGIDTAKRIKQVKDFFAYSSDTAPNDLIHKKEFLQRENIRYIYLSQTGIYSQPLMEVLKLLPVFSNDEVRIYQVKT